MLGMGGPNRGTTDTASISVGARSPPPALTWTTQCPPVSPRWPLTPQQLPQCWSSGRASLSLRKPSRVAAAPLRGPPHLRTCRLQLRGPCLTPRVGPAASRLRPLLLVPGGFFVVSLVVGRLFIRTPRTSAAWFCRDFVVVTRGEVRSLYPLRHLDRPPG